jgi:hypothetical protein
VFGIDKRGALRLPPKGMQLTGNKVFEHGVGGHGVSCPDRDAIRPLPLLSLGIGLAVRGPDSRAPIAVDAAFPV